MSPQPGRYVTVRMYNVGFGDSFLVRFPAEDGRERKVLIDCGVHTMASIKPPPIAGVVQQIIQDATDPDGVPRLDVVIATHRHQDHVHGFGDKAWDAVEVREVWMPWTEHPTNPEAKRIRTLQSTSASKAHKSAKRKLTMSLTAAQREAAERQMVLASNNLTNQRAMTTLHQGFARNGAFALRRYLPTKEGGETLKTRHLPGVNVHVMGPSHNPDVIENMEKDSEMYHLLSILKEATEEGRPPFRQEWCLDRARFKSRHPHLKFDKKMLEAVAAANEDDEFAATAKLEDAVNGTSLMIMFEVGNAYLLFPGDAEWGTWEQALNNPRWRELLAKTTFYKIGHHGSHNATPITFVEKVLGKNFWAMACTGPTQKWTHIIPRPKLMAKLRDKSDKVVRSDKKDVPDPTASNFKRAPKNAYTEVRLRV